MKGKRGKRYNLKSSWCSVVRGSPAGAPPKLIRSKCDEEASSLHLLTSQRCLLTSWLGWRLLQTWVSVLHGDVLVLLVGGTMLRRMSSWWVLHPPCVVVREVNLLAAGVTCGAAGGRVGILLGSRSILLSDCGSADTLLRLRRGSDNCGFLRGSGWAVGNRGQWSGGTACSVVCLHVAARRASLRTAGS